MEAGLYDIDSTNGADWLVWLEIGRNWESFFINEYLGSYRVHSKGQHQGMMSQRKAEKDAFYVIDKIYSYKDLPKNVVKIKRKVYANLYISNIVSYLGFGYCKDVRRCFKKAIKYYLPAIFNFRALICFFMSFLRIEDINRIKTIYGKIKHRRKV